MLEGLNYLFIYRNRVSNEIEYFEAVFLPRNFQHLTGVEFLDMEGNLQKNSVFFYHKCLDNTLTEDEFRFKEDDTTPLKLEALPKLIQFLRFSKMTALYNGIRAKLAVDRVAGTINYCLGFIKDGDYFVPSSCSIYKEIRYVAKGVPLNKLKMSDELNNLISLEKYIEK